MQLHFAVRYVFHTGHVSSVRDVQSISPLFVLTCWPSDLGRWARVRKNGPSKELVGLIPTTSSGHKVFPFCNSLLSTGISLIGCRLFASLWLWSFNSLCFNLELNILIALICHIIRGWSIFMSTPLWGREQDIIPCVLHEGCERLSEDWDLLAAEIGEAEDDNDERHGNDAQRNGDQNLEQLPFFPCWKSG